MLLVFLATLFGENPHTTDIGFKATLDSLDMYNPHLTVQLEEEMLPTFLDVYDPVLTISVPATMGTFVTTDTVYNSPSVEYNSGTQVYGGFGGFNDNPPDSFIVGEFKPYILGVGNK